MVRAEGGGATLVVLDVAGGDGTGRIVAVGVRSMGLSGAAVGTTEEHAATGSAKEANQTNPHARDI